MGEDENHQFRKVPFNTYDFFGYLIPGATFLLSCFLFDHWFKSHANAGDQFLIHGPFKTIAINLYNSKLIESAFLSFLYLLLIILIAYIVGHVVSSLSSFAIDRVLISKGYEYPIRTLIDKRSEYEPETVDSKGRRIRASFVYINGILVFCYFGLSIIGIFDFPYEMFWRIFIIFASMMVIILSFVFVFRLKDKSSKLNWWAGLGTKIYDWCTYKLAHYLKSRETLRKEIRDRYTEFVKTEFGLPVKPFSSDIYWLTTLYIKDNNPGADAMLTNWLHMYSYARNIATAFYLASVYGIFVIAYHKTIPIQIDLISYLLPPILMALAFIMLARFYYLYVSYYTKYLIRAAVYEYGKNKSDRDN